MKLNSSQTKLVEYTMKLDLKAREYKMLCDKLEKYKKSNIDENDEKLYKLLDEFKQNYIEIAEIKQQLLAIENIEDNKTNIKNNEDIFEKKKKNNDIAVPDTSLVNKKEKSVFDRILSKIKKYIAKMNKQ